MAEINSKAKKSSGVTKIISWLLLIFFLGLRAFTCYKYYFITGEGLTEMNV